MLVLSLTRGGGRRAPELARNPASVLGGVFDPPMMKVRSPAAANQALQLNAEAEVKEKLHKEAKREARMRKQDREGGPWKEGSEPKRVCFR